MSNDSLTGKTPANTYKELLHLSSDNMGVDDSLRQVFGGNGNATGIYVAEDETQVDFMEGLAIKPVLSSFRVSTANLSSITDPALSIDLEDGNIQRMTLETSVSSTTITSLPTSGDFFELILFIAQDGVGGRTMTWPAGTKWPGGSAPTLTATGLKTDIIKLFTIDGGTTWFGLTVALNYA